jgi:hypothetical protein
VEESSASDTAGKKIASEGNLRLGGACRSIRHKIKTGTSSRHWRSVVSGYWRSLYKTKLAAASPFLCCLVVVRLKDGLLACHRTNDDNGSVSECSGRSGDGRHTILRFPQFAERRSIQTICRLFSSCGTGRLAHVDKARAPPENRSFSWRRGIAFSDRSTHDKSG